MSVAPLPSSCLESTDLAGPNLTCGHGFLCVSLPVDFGLNQGARYCYPRLSVSDGFPISEASSEGTAPFCAQRFQVLDKARLVLGLLFLESGAGQFSSTAGAFSFIKQHRLCIPGPTVKRNGALPAAFSCTEHLKYRYCPHLTSPP